MRPMTWQDYRDHLDAMTLGEAHEMLTAPPIGCACVGGPPGFGACFCRLGFGQAERLKRAAHIVAKLVDDAAGRTGGDDVG